MPFTMTHLLISKNVYSLFGQNISSLPQFYLGSIAPDAVHNRAGYISDYKKSSHLCVGPEKWGRITNDIEWVRNITSFLSGYRESENRDFVLGYCSHLLSDSYNNRTVWTPFRLKHPDEQGKGYGNISHQESNKVDIELALTYEGRDAFWRNLSQSSSIDLPGIIYRTEIDQQKDYILNQWYKGKDRQDLSSNRFVTLESTQGFIERATDYVSSNFQALFEK
jgi:hypothetical protein